VLMPHGLYNDSAGCDLNFMTA